MQPQRFSQPRRGCRPPRRRPPRLAARWRRRVHRRRAPPSATASRGGTGTAAPCPHAPPTAMGAAAASRVVACAPRRTAGWIAPRRRPLRSHVRLRRARRWPVRQGRRRALANSSARVAASVAARRTWRHTPRLRAATNSVRARAGGQRAPNPTHRGARRGRALLTPPDRVSLRRSRRECDVGLTGAAAKGEDAVVESHAAAAAEGDAW
jgi:hypothetical protein